MRNPENKFRYIITNRLGVLQVQPLGESNFTIEWTRETGGKLDYKNVLPSKITFTGLAYQNLLKLERSVYRCDFISLSVQRRCISGGAESWITFFSGRLSNNDGDWDLDRCQVVIKMDNIKEDQCVEENKGKEIDLLQNIFPRRTVFLNPTDITIETVSYEISGAAGSDACSNTIVWGGVGSPSSGGWAYYSFSTIVDTLGGPGTEFCTSGTAWAREVMTLACGAPDPGPEWILVLDTCPSGEKKYARPPRLYACKYTFPVFGEAYQITSYSCNIVGDSATNVTIDNGIALSDVVNLFMSMFCPGLTFVSDFLQINPDIVSDINYVTGQHSKTRFITLFQKSDMKRPTVTGNATKAPLSFDKLIEMLVTTYNMRWRIVGNQFRMEHVSFFTRSAGMDLTVPAYAKYMVGKRKYSYQTDEIPGKEEFKFMEAGPGDFQGLPIVYTGGCVSQASRDNVKTYSVEKFTTDIELILANPDPDSKVVSDEGFALVACDFDGTNYYIISESQILGGSSLNNSLAWAQLHRDYHKWDRPLLTGIMNNVQTAFLTSKPTKKGEKISIPFCCGDIFNPDNTIKTLLGDGVVDKATFSFKDETLELELLYPADQNLTTNAFPVAVNDVIQTYQDQAITSNLLANDSDIDSPIVRIEILFQPIHGTATINADMTVTYTPDAGYTGDDFFSYRIYDDWSQASNNGQVAIIVFAPNSAPIANNDNYVGFLDTVLHILTPGIFINDSDDVSFSLGTFDTISAQGGTVAINPDGSFFYTPPAGFTGIDTFSYSIIDGAALSDAALVTIDVRNPNNPVTTNDNYLTRRNTNLTIAAPGILNNDTNTVGTLTAVAGTFATTQGGTITIAADGGFTYAPPTGFVGDDTYVYTATNGTGSNTATINIKVIPIVYVKLQKQVYSSGSTYQECSSGPEVATDFEFSYFRLFFYSNSAGTTPMDVSGLGLEVFYRKTGTGYTIDGSAFVTGTQYLLFGGPYENAHTDYACFGGVSGSFSESISLRPGNYTII